LAALGLMAGLAACTSPNPTLYTIAPVAGADRSAGAAAGLKVVLVRQVGLAHYLERAQIVRSSEHYKLDVMSNDWWGEPLAGMLSRVLVEELSQRLPQSVVISESGAVSATPDATIEVDVQRLDEDAAGILVLQAQASVNFQKKRAPALQNFRITVPPPMPGTSGEVAAISTAVGQLADGLASMTLAGSPAR
jgi:uncharacterized lipoprotein YmbA